MKSIKSAAAALLIFSIALLVPANTLATSFTFGSAGDFGNGTNFQANMKLLGQQSVAGTDPIKFFIAQGDLSYGNSPSAWCQAVKSNINAGAGKPVGDAWGETFPFQIVSGNHEDNVAGAIIDNFTSCLPNRMPNVVLSPNYSGPAGTSNYGKEYYFDYPATNPIARFIFVSPGLSMTNGGSYSYPANSARLNWVKSSIDSARAAGIPWVIANMHHNAIDTGPKPNQVGADMWNLFLSKDSAGRQRVDLVLQGHDHAWARSYALAVGQSGCSTFTFDAYNSACVVNSTNTTTKNTGTVLNINGLGGNGSYPQNAADPENKYFAAYAGSTAGSESKPAGGNGTWGIAKITVSDNPMRLTTQFIRSAGGNYTDSYSIVGSGVSTPPPTPPGPTPLPTATVRPTATPTPRPPTATPTGTAVAKIGDVNGDGVVDIVDIGIVVDNYGKSPIPNKKADLNNDNKVDIIDIGIIIDHYQK